MNFIADIITFISGTSTDMLFIVIILVLSLGSSFYFGSNFIVNLILSWYISLAVFGNINLVKLTTFPKLIVFAGIIVVIYFAIRKIVNIYETYVRTRRIMRSVIFALSLSILIFVTLIYVVPINDFHTFSPLILKIFAAKYLVFWLSAPIISLYLAHRV